MQAIRVQGLGAFVGLGSLALLGWVVGGVSLDLPAWKTAALLAAPVVVPPALAAATIRVSQEDLSENLGEVLEIESVEEEDEED